MMFVHRCYVHGSCLYRVFVDRADEVAGAPYQGLIKLGMDCSSEVSKSHPVKHVTNWSVKTKMTSTPSLGPSTDSCLEFP